MKFKRGQSGNPAGRARGSRNRATALRQSVERDGEKVLAVVVDRALGGDLDAAKFLLSRILPSARDLPAMVKVDRRASLASRGEKIIGATLSGRLAPDAAGAMIDLLRQQSALVEHADLAARVEALEQNWREPGS